MLLISTKGLTACCMSTLMQNEREHLNSLQNNYIKQASHGYLNENIRWRGKINSQASSRDR